MHSELPGMQLCHHAKDKLEFHLIECDHRTNNVDNGQRTNYDTFGTSHTGIESS
jgi:hypothetical protein